MELLFEIIFELYLELMMFIVPDEGKTPKKYRKKVALIAIAVLLGVLALLIWGCILISNYNNYFGFIPIIIAIVISVIQIIAGFILHDKKSKKRI